MDHKYVGPFTITKCLGRGLYSLQSIENPDVVINSVNGVHIKPYLTPPNSFSTLSCSNSSHSTSPVDKSVPAQLSNCTAGDICNTPVEVSSSDSCSKKRSESSTSIPIIKHSNNLSKQYSIEGGQYKQGHP